MATGQNDAEKFLNAQLRDKGAPLTPADISHISDLAATLNELLPMVPADDDPATGYYKCPVCDGDGTVDAEQYGHCRTAGAAGIQVYGCGIEHVKLAAMLNESGPKLAALCEMASVGLACGSDHVYVIGDDGKPVTWKMQAEHQHRRAERFKAVNDEKTGWLLEAREEIAKLRDMRDQDSKELSEQCTVSYLQGRASRNDEVRALVKERDEASAWWWIDCKERMPDSFGEYLGSTRARPRGWVYVLAPVGWITSPDYPVTHWMPLPAPPEKAKGAGDGGGG